MQCVISSESVCGFVECSDLTAPHVFHDETGKPAKESKKRKAVLSKLLTSTKTVLTERTNRRVCVKQHGSQLKLT